LKEIKKEKEKEMHKREVFLARFKKGSALS
jgi:hypothetical protein